MGPRTTRIPGSETPVTRSNFTGADELISLSSPVPDYTL